MSYRFGLIMGTKTTDYPRMVRLGIQNTLEAGGHTLICLADFIPDHTHANAECYMRTIFELTRSLDLDAIIVPIGTVCGYLNNDLDKTYKLLSLLDPSKTLVMERDVPGYRCITKDSRTGMRECIRHLIEEEGHERIAFVSGSATSKGARDREQAYFDEMVAHGLATPNGYSVRGDFSGDCREVIEQLLDEHSHIEAIACASDKIAFTLYQVMRSRNLEVGRDIAVTGFDGVYDYEHLDPPLATVRITGYDFGSMAAREALRLCEGLPQLETIQTGEFVPRESCGAPASRNIAQLSNLLHAQPFPTDKIVSLILESSLKMAGADLTARFHRQLNDLVVEALGIFKRRLAHPDVDAELFPPLRLTILIAPEYRGFFSLEGFRTAVVSMLDALALDFPDQAPWLAAQASLLHLHIARFLNVAMQRERLAYQLREWQTLQLTEDALREDAQPQEVYRLMLADLERLGIRWADLFLLEDAIYVMATPTFMLTDTLWHVGSLCQGKTTVGEAMPVSPRELLDYSLSRHGHTQLCSVGGILAGDELLGVVAMDGGTLDDNGQLMAMVNMGLALKHLQNMASIREMNDILNRNNLQLARQSQCDEMTGLLNRRGLHEGVLPMMRCRIGSFAAVLYVDLDGLKYINDTFGHEAGDTAILDMAHVLQTSLPGDSLLARMGGDEFVAFFPVADEQEAQACVASIERNLASANAGRNRRSVPYELSTSIGLCCFAIRKDYEEAFSNAVLQADKRMYRIKRQHHQYRTSVRSAGMGV